MRPVLSVVLGASLLLVGCGTRSTDFSDLPGDAAERAKLCFGAAQTFRKAGADEGVDAAELARRQSLESDMREATLIDDFVPAGAWEAFDVEANRQLNTGNWLLDLNRCKIGYGIGEPEPLPSLPEDEGDRLFVCAMASAIKARGSDVSRPIILQHDPQGFHFAHMLVGREGVDRLASRMTEVHRAGGRILLQGAVDSFVDRCVEEHPTAALDHPVQLPEEEPLRAGICSYVSGALIGGGADNPLRGEYLPRVERLAAPLGKAGEGISPAELRLLEREIEKKVGALGPSTSIFAACEKAYLGDASIT